MNRPILTFVEEKELREADRQMREAGIPLEGRQRAIAHMREIARFGYVDPDTH